MSEPMTITGAPQIAQGALGRESLIARVDARGVGGLTPGEPGERSATQ